MKYRVICHREILADSEWRIGQQDFLLKWLPQFLYRFHDRRIMFRKRTLTQDSTPMKIRIEGLQFDGLHLIFTKKVLRWIGTRQKMISVHR